MKFASVRLALRTFRPRRTSPRRFVPVRSTLSSVAPFRFACHRSARTSLIEERLAFDKSARRRLALSKFNPLKFTPLRLQLAHDPVSVSVCRSSPSTRAHCQYKTLATNEKNPAISNRFLDTTEETDADKHSRSPSNLDHLFPLDRN
jgi:hypothetical protein